MFHDKYITEDINMYIWDYFLNILTNDEMKFSSYDFTDVEVI